MTKAVQKITLSPSRDIPFDELMLTQSNVRRIKAGVSVEELAEDIARRGLLQSLSVRPVLGANGTETGKLEIQGGGRRLQALALLVKVTRGFHNAAEELQTAERILVYAGDRDIPGSGGVRAMPLKGALDRLASAQV